MFFNKKLTELEKMDFENYKKEREEKGLTKEEERREKINDELMDYIYKTFPGIENPKSPYRNALSFYSTINEMVKLSLYFGTDKKLMGDIGFVEYKYTKEYVGLFKKFVSFFRKEIYDNIPE